MKEKYKTPSSRVINFQPDGDYYFQKGISAYQKGDLQRASKFINRAIVFQPDDVDYLCQQAAIYSEMEEYEASNELLNKVVQDLDPDASECYFFMANNYAYLGRFDEALREVRNYMAMDPDGPFKEESQELYRLINMESSTVFEEDEDYVADHEKGRKALQKGEYDKAIQLFRMVLEEKPEFWAAYNNLAIAYFSSGDHKLAFETIKQILEQDPGNVHALCNLVTFYDDKGETEQLNEVLPLLEGLYPFFPDHRMKLGSTYLFIGQYEKAFHWLMSAEKAGVHSDQPFYFWLALASYHTGRKSFADWAFRKMDFFSKQPFHPFQYGLIKRLLISSDAGKNQLIRSMIREALHDADHHTYQIFSIFYLDFLQDEEAQSELQRFINKTDDRLLKKIGETVLDPESAEPANRDSLEIIYKLQSYFSEGLPAVNESDIYSWWAMVFDMTQDDQHMDTDGWAAALAYLWLKETGNKTSQKELAGHFQVSVHRLKKHVDYLKRTLVY